MLRTIFMGTPDIAVPALRALAQRTTITTVITQPDRPAGRGNAVTPPPVKTAAQELGLPVWQPETVKGQASDPRFDEVDLAIVMAYGELLRQDVLDRPRGGCFNLHASLLPRWRGASPLQAAIRAGDQETGVTVMRMVRALDAGAMYLNEAVAIGPRTTLPELHDALALAAARALIRFLDRWPDVTGTEQDSALVTTCHKLTGDDGRLGFHDSAIAIDRWIRAYTPAPGCWVPLADDRLKLLSVTPIAGIGDAPGTVRLRNNQLLIACGDGAIQVERIQAPGKKAMAVVDFLRGQRLLVDGQILG